MSSLKWTDYVPRGLFCNLIGASKICAANSQQKLYQASYGMGPENEANSHVPVTRLTRTTLYLASLQGDGKAMWMWVAAISPHQWDGRGHVSPNTNACLGWPAWNLWVCGGTGDWLAQFFHQRQVLRENVFVCVHMGGGGGGERGYTPRGG